MDRSATNRVLNEAIEFFSVISVTSEAYIIDRAIMEGLLPRYLEILMGSTPKMQSQILF